MNQIIRSEFQCFAESPNAVTFRVSVYLNGSSQVYAQQFVRALVEWITSGASISVQAQLLQADEMCAVLISSFSDPGCQQEEPTTPPNFTVTTLPRLNMTAPSSNISVSGSLNTFLISIVAAVGAVVLIVFVCVPVLTMVCISSKRKKKATGNSNAQDMSV